MRRALFSVFLFFTFAFTFSQNQEQPQLKVGLVLSGGGAKGFAHIGVLKVLEEAGVKISYIGGTSMGAVVGGLYASGYTATQIDSIFRKINFNELLNDYIPRSSKNFYEKRNEELYAFNLPFYKFKVGIPLALSKGMYNFNLLTRLTHNIRHIRDFSQLPIPFLCIATDIETGEQVLLDKGYLPQALVASSAFPTLFSPIEIDGKLLVDGGVLNNYPIEEVKKMGADFIIGVDVQDELRDRSDLTEATKILVQISNIQMNERTKQKVADTNIYIKPKMDGFGVISFDDGSDIIKRGEEAAFSVYEKLKAIGIKSQPHPITLRPIKNDTIAISNINVNKLVNHSEAFVHGKLDFKPGKKITYTDLKKGMDNLSATKDFSAITYSLEPGMEGDDLNVELTENSVRNFLKFGIHYDEVYKSGFLVNLTRKKFFFKNDVTSVDLILGDNFRGNFDYYVDHGFNLSYGFKSRYNMFNKNIPKSYTDVNVFNQNTTNSINIDYSDFSNQAYLQAVYFQKFLLGGGVEYKLLKIDSETINAASPLIENSDYFSAFGYLKFDSYDNRYFPKSGWLFSGDFQSYLYSSNYTHQFNPFSILKGELGYATSFWNKLAFNAQVELGFPIGPVSVPFFDFMLGGYGYNTVNNFKPMFGYQFSSLVGNSYAKSQFIVDYEFYRKNHLNFTINLADVNDRLFEDTDWLVESKYKGFAAGYGLETILGPMELKYSWSKVNPKGFAWVVVGFWF